MPKVMDLWVDMPFFIDVYKRERERRGVVGDRL